MPDGEVAGDMASPRMAEDRGVRYTQVVHETRYIACERTPIVATAGLGGLAVAPLVGGDDAKPVAQVGRD